MNNGTGQPLVDRGARSQGRHREDGPALEPGQAPDAVIELVAANLAGDRDRLEAVLAPDLELVDHRTAPPLPFASRGAVIAGMVELGVTDTEAALVATNADGLVTLLEFYDAEDLARALDRHRRVG